MKTGRAIDHVGIASRSLDGLASRYEQLDFTLTPRAQHPDHIGTSNRLAQFSGANFVELIEVDRPGAIAPVREGAMNFGAFTRDLLARREGISLIAFRTADRDADLARWQAAGLDIYAPFDFERLATLPDGTQQVVRFELGFVTHPDIDALFFVCDNKAEEHFWKPEYQKHANAAESLHAVVLCAEDPMRHTAFLSALFGGRVQAGEAGQEDGIRVECEGGFIAVCTPAVLEPFGWKQEPGSRAVPAGIEVRSALHAGRTTARQDAGDLFIRWI